MKMTPNTTLRAIAFACALCVTSVTFAAVPAQQPNATVEFENEVKTLAKGFSQAFSALPLGAKYIIVRTHEGATHLPGSARTVKAFDGVLLIQMENGLVHAISARDIIRITTEKPKPTKS
jgi:hypothetical protein